MTSAADQTANVKQKITQGIMPVNVNVVKVTQSDWISFAWCKGVHLPSAVVQVTTGPVVETPMYGTVTINNSGTAYSATDTAIIIASGLATRLTPYYLRSASGEILEVVAESAPATAAGTLTVKRGALGTTASATGLANGNVLSVCNQIVLASSAVGGVLMRCIAITGEPGPMDMFK